VFGPAPRALLEVSLHLGCVRAGELAALESAEPLGRALMNVG
jgi:hypothetical protein